MRVNFVALTMLLLVILPEEGWADIQIDYAGICEQEWVFDKEVDVSSEVKDKFIESCRWIMKGSNNNDYHKIISDEISLGSSVSMFIKGYYIYKFRPDSDINRKIAIDFIMESSFGEIPYAHAFLHNYYGLEGSPHYSLMQNVVSKLKYEESIIQYPLKH